MPERSLLYAYVSFSIEGQAVQDKKETCIDSRLHHKKQFPGVIN